MSGGDLILYTAGDGSAVIRLRAEDGTVWLTQLEMAALFDTSKQNIAKHLKAIVAEGELSPDSVVNQWLTTAACQPMVDYYCGRRQEIQGWPLQS